VCVVRTPEILQGTRASRGHLCDSSAFFLLLLLVLLLLLLLVLLLLLLLIIIIIIIIIMRQFTLRCLLAQSLTCMPRVRTLISTSEQGCTVWYDSRVHDGLHHSKDRRRRRTSCKQCSKACFSCYDNGTYTLIQFYMSSATALDHTLFVVCTEDGTLKSDDDVDEDYRLRPGGGGGVQRWQWRVATTSRRQQNAVSEYIMYELCVIEQRETRQALVPAVTSAL